MASLRIQNALLFVIAVCLVLLVVHAYSGHLIAKAYADTISVPPAPKGADAVVLYGCYRANDDAVCDWKALKVDKFGNLFTAPK